MEAGKLISSLCYFSIFFAGFIVPLVIYFITNDYEVRHHAKRALVSHILPFFSLFLLLILLLPRPYISGLIVLGVLSAVLYFVVIIWNIIKGIQVLMER
jgi:multisubunit Na+/H+ antiporter MnhE subunit